MKPLILVVEDNVDLLYAINLLLESNNYKALTAKNGKEALKVLSRLEEAMSGQKGGSPPGRKDPESQLMENRRALQDTLLVLVLDADKYSP